MILYMLPTRDLLLAQGVNREWKGVITSSRKLRRALFLEPIPTGTKPKAVFTEPHRQPSSMGGVVRNPLLSALFDFLKHMELDYVGTFEREILREEWDMRSWLFPEASWKNMFATQPPNHSDLEVRSITYDFQGYEHERSRKVSLDVPLGCAIDRIDNAITNVWGYYDGSEDSYVFIRFGKTLEEAQALASNYELEDVIREHQDA